MEDAAKLDSPTDLDLELVLLLCLGFKVEVCGFRVGGLSLRNLF